MPRWPLKLSAPVTASRTATSRSASARTMPVFFAPRPDHAAQPMRRRMALLQHVAHALRADEREHVNPARRHERRRSDLPGRRLKRS